VWTLSGDDMSCQICIRHNSNITIHKDNPVIRKKMREHNSSEGHYNLLRQRRPLMSCEGPHVVLPWDAVQANLKTKLRKKASRTLQRTTRRNSNKEPTLPALINDGPAAPGVGKVCPPLSPAVSPVLSRCCMLAMTAVFNAIVLLN